MKTKIDSSAAFREQTQIGEVYRFPFTCLDPMPGGGNLGRIEWHVELLRDARIHKIPRIAAVLVWATQTRDLRYVGRMFKLPFRTETVMTHVSGGVDYFHRVWQAGFCREHNALSFSAYPDTVHTTLVVENMSSVGNRIYFEAGS